MKGLTEDERKLIGDYLKEGMNSGKTE